jgi:hypothetical protein
MPADHRGAEWMNEYRQALAPISTQEVRGNFQANS